MRTDPTLADVPGIFLRTGLRLLARVIFTLAGVTLLLGAALLFVSALLATWRSPRSNRTTIAARLIEVTLHTVREFRKRQTT